MSKQVKGKIKIIPLVILMRLLRSDQKKNHTHTRYLLFKLFFRQVDFPSFLHLFALILFEKSLQIPKNIEKTKDVSTCKIPISPINMRQWRKIVPFFPEQTSRFGSSRVKTFRRFFKRCDEDWRAAGEIFGGEELLLAAGGISSNQKEKKIPVARIVVVVR